MKGTNILSLNCATVIEALQEYFDARIPKKEDQFTITGIHLDNNFLRVTLTEKEKTS